MAWPVREKLTKLGLLTQKEGPLSLRGRSCEVPRSCLGMLLTDRKCKPLLENSRCSAAVVSSWCPICWAKGAYQACESFSMLRRGRRVHTFTVVRSYHTRAPPPSHRTHRPYQRLSVSFSRLTMPQNILMRRRFFLGHSSSHRINHRLTLNNLEQHLPFCPHHCLPRRAQIGSTASRT